MEAPEQFYEKMREGLIATSSRNEEALDRFIFVAATGALVATVGVLSSFFPTSLFQVILLILALISLLGSLILQALSYEKMITDGKVNIKALDKWQADDFKPLHFRFPAGKEPRYSGRTWHDYLSARMLASGVVLLALFLITGVLNQYGEQRKNTKHGPRTHHEEGYRYRPPARLQP